MALHDYYMRVMLPEPLGNNKAATHADKIYNRWRNIVVKSVFSFSAFRNARVLTVGGKRRGLNEHTSALDFQHKATGERLTFFGGASSILNMMSDKPM